MTLKDNFKNKKKENREREVEREEVEVDDTIALGRLKS